MDAHLVLIHPRRIMQRPEDVHRVLLLRLDDRLLDVVVDGARSMPLNIIAPKHFIVQLTSPPCT